MPTAPTLRAEPVKLIACCATIYCTAVVLAVPALGQRIGININIGVQIETRGPVHEAYAEPVVFETDPGLMVPQQPPPLIEEVPPLERPEGDFVTWVPGYWGWDDERRSHLWVSGIWRNMPPGRQFVPGYWAQTPGGHQWISGFWLNASYPDVEYLPEPPEPISLEPVGPPPALDYIWVPGCWLWQQGTYLWRPGYWIAPQPDWMWVPAHYVWTPSGYVFVSGYWDYNLPRRGLLFAPALIDRSVMTRPGFAYTPTVVINSQVLVENLFARPGNRHYYFGDYYAPEYRRAGIIPIHTFHHSPRSYSSIYAHALAVHRRTDPNWERQFIRNYEIRRDRADARPPRTWAAIDRVRGSRAVREDPIRSRAVTLARPLTELAGARDTREVPFRLQRTAPEQRDSQRQQLSKLREYQTQRRQLELSSADKSPLRLSRDQVRVGQGTPARRPERPDARPAQAPPAPRAQPSPQDRTRGQVRPDPQRPEVEAPRSMRLKLPRSPLSVQTKELEKSKAPPARPKVPKVDPSAQPKPRVQSRERTAQTRPVTPQPSPRRRG